MGVLKVQCYKCRSRYQINAGMIHHIEANKCPYCFAELPRDTWERIVVPAFGELEDANRELYKEHSGYIDTPLFQIGYTPSKPYKREE